jgi:hypothetical protein
MGTRSLTVVKDIDNNEVMVMYRQYDGYPSGHGQELADFLSGKSMVNGLSGDTSLVFNGTGCLAASIVAHFKKEAGSFYLYPSGTRDCGEEFIYTLTPTSTGSLTLKVESGYGDRINEIYNGPIDAFDGDALEDVGF